MTEVIRLEHIFTRFGDLIVHEDISLNLNQGEILGLVGASGSGKTVLMREMIALHSPTQGQVYLFGEPILELPEARRQELRNRCGMLFQNGALFSALNVYDNIAFPLRELGCLDEETIRALVYQKLTMVGLTAEHAFLSPAELSGGMVRRTALARALILEPELLFLDEPTSGLDPVLSEEFVNLLGDLHRQLGFTVVMITHDLHVLRDICTKIALLADHRLIAFGDLATVLACDHPFARRFLHGRRAQRIFGKAADG